MPPPATTDAEARVHTQASNRAQKKKPNKPKPTSRPGEDDRKVVFKSVLDNPLQVSWPNIPLNVQNNLLAGITDLVLEAGISAYHQNRERIAHDKRRSRRNVPKREQQDATNESQLKQKPPSAKKRKARAEDEQTESDGRSAKKRKLDSELPEPDDSRNPPEKHTDSADVEVISDQPIAPNNLPNDTPSPQLSAPSFLSHLVIGINAVTKRIEKQIAQYRQPVSYPPTEPIISPLRYVFVCKADVNPPGLLEHLPLLIAACNASQPKEHVDPEVILVALPKGAEHVLTEALGLRRAAVLGIEAAAPQIGRFAPFASSLPVLSAPWLVSAAAASRNSTSTPIPPLHLEPTHVKQLKTTAPKDIRASKERRAEGRASAKQRKKERKKEERTKVAVAAEDTSGEEKNAQSTADTEMSVDH